MIYRCELCDEMKDSDESGGYEWEVKDACGDCLEDKVGQLNTDDFLQGQKDCMDGVPHKMGMGKDYHRGYAAQYGLEQVATEMELKQCQ